MVQGFEPMSDSQPAPMSATASGSGSHQPTTMLPAADLQSQCLRHAAQSPARWRHRYPADQFVQFVTDVNPGIG